MLAVARPINPAARSAALSIAALGGGPTNVLLVFLRPNRFFRPRES